MAYTKQTWVRGEKVASAKLNHMEDGIDAISANGAIGTANLANASVTNNKLDQEAVDSDNIRTGAIITPLIYDGAVTTAKIADGAITDAKLAASGVKSDVSDLKSAIGNDIISVTVDKGTLVADSYVKDNGDFASYGGWSRTGYLSCENWLTVTLSIASNYCAFYDANKAFVARAQFTANTAIDVPSLAKYIAISSTTVNMAAVTITATYDGLGKRLSVCERDIASINADVSDIENQIAETPASEIIPELTIIQNSQVTSSTGVISESDTNSRSDYTIIDKAESIKLTGATFFNCCFYKRDKTFISGTTTTSGNISVPSGAYYAIFTASKATAGNAVLTLNNVGTIITVIHDDINWCKGKKINWIGDSIVDGPDFDEIVVTRLELVKQNEYGINGSTISLNGNGSDGRNALCERYDDMTDDADIVAVSCGTNDWMYAWAPVGTINDADDGSSNTTFYGACKALCKGLIDKYPQKVVFFTTPIKRAQAFENGNGGEYTEDGVMTTPYSKNKYGKTLGDYADIIKEVCGYYSIPVLDMYRESMLNPHIASQQDMFDSAKTHPNATGQKVMARRCAAWLRALEIDV